MGWRRIAIHLAVLASVAIAYLVVRIGVAPSGGFLRFHLTDLLAGIALPSSLALAVEQGGWSDWVRSPGGKLSTTIGATMVWEGIMPLVSAHATADPIDALCYVIGTLIQHAVIGRR